MAEINESRNVFRRSIPWPTGYPPFAQPQGKGLISMVSHPVLPQASMIILLTFRSFAREKKQESSQNFTIVLNLFAEIIVHSSLFILVSMYQKVGIESNNAFFKTPRRSIISLSMQFQGAARPFYAICTSIERQQQKISAAPALKIRNKRFLQQGINGGMESSDRALVTGRSREHHFKVSEKFFLRCMGQPHPPYRHYP